MIGQVKDPILLAAYYNLTHRRDTLSNVPRYTEHMVLLLAEKGSIYVSYDKIRRRISKHQEIQEALRKAQGKIPNIGGDPGRAVTPMEIRKDYGDTTFQVDDFLGTYYRYAEHMPAIQWTFYADSTKEIDGLVCKKASGTIKGRIWEVWYAKEIPFSAGPWFLYGLPGLILEAKDASGDIGFELVQLQPDVGKDHILTAYLIAVGYAKEYKVHQIKKNQFLKLKALLYRDPKGFKNANAKSNMFVQNYGLLNSDSWLKAVPNPIDLEDR